MTEDVANTIAPVGPVARLPATYWLIVRNEDEGEAGRTQALTVDLDGQEEALAVFSFEEEAKMFLWFGAPTGWHKRKVTAGELLWMLSGPCAAIEFVALDPLPELVQRRMIGLVNLSRKRFVAGLIDKVASSATRPGSEYCWNGFTR
jgi:hypothetical protein